MRLLTLALLCLLPVTAHAKGSNVHDYPAAIHKSGKKQCTPSTRAYKEAFQRMHEQMAVGYTGNTDIDFVRGMIPHHQGAVDMAKVVLEHGSDPEIRGLAEWIITVQELEIARMKRWLATQGRSAPAMTQAEINARPSVAAFKQAMENMHRKMQIDFTGNADVDFARGMIPHHLGAIDMAGILLKHGINPEMQSLGWGVVRTQSQEIGKMQRWLKRHSAE